MTVAPDSENPTRTLVLVHSPFVGPGTWRALTPLLEARGYPAIVPDLRGALHATPPLYFRLTEAVTGQIRDATECDTIVAHSGAGALVPLLARRNRQLRTVVFVDALLPHPGKRWIDTVPAELAQHLRALAKGGNLPRWHRWWPRGAMEAIVPDEAMRAAFIAELHETPVAYLNEAAPLGDVPDTLSCAYLQLSAACKVEADQAERRGWQVRRLDLDHLAMLTHAQEVASELIELLKAGDTRF